jgi:anhydro-N-acetylmuramic acid kinase
MRVLGFMTGTSLDGVDVAELETDGESMAKFGPSAEYPISEPCRAAILRAISCAKSWLRGSPEPAEFAVAASVIAEEHFRAATAFLVRYGLDWSRYDCIGVHGQTVLHERPVAGQAGRTVQLLDAPLLARLCGRPVVYDFRSADVAAGGEGAPLAPIYHAALVHRASGISDRSNLALSTAAVLNLGGVANVTFVERPRDESAAGRCLGGGLRAFDTGPGNGLLDSLVASRGLGRCDENGALAARGRVDSAALTTLLSDPYFSAPPPKSLDRYAFSLAPVTALSDADAAATLVAFTVESVALAFAFGPPEGVRTLVVCGGGRHNRTLMAALRTRLGAPPLDICVESAEAVGWRGDALEAEAFAFLAARVMRGLPLSFPGTTGVPRPTHGGRVCMPE